MDPTPLAAAVATLVAALTAILNEVRRGAWLPRFVYDREAAARDLSDQRGDKLEATVEALNRALVDEVRATAREVSALREVIVRLDAQVVELVRRDGNGPIP